MKAVIVLDGRTGVAAMRIDVPGTVWTISLLHLPGEPRPRHRRRAAYHHTIRSQEPM